MGGKTVQQSAENFGWMYSSFLESAEETAFQKTGANSSFGLVRLKMC